MLPTLARTSDNSEYVHAELAARRVPKVLTELDEQLFDPAAWFALGKVNQRVAGVAIPSLRSGLDLAGERGQATVEALTGWCEREPRRPVPGSLGRRRDRLFHRSRWRPRMLLGCRATVRLDQAVRVEAGRAGHDHQ